VSRVSPLEGLRVAAFMILFTIALAARFGFSLPQ
jgi:hypothetical protein